MTEQTQPVMGYLIPYEWQEPMNGDFGANEVSTMNGDSGEDDDDVPEPEDYSDYDTTGEFTLR
jgi:hypothetical protein